MPGEQRPATAREASLAPSSVASRSRSRSGSSPRSMTPSTASEITPALLGDHDDHRVRLLGQADRGAVARAERAGEAEVAREGQEAAGRRDPVSLDERGPVVERRSGLEEAAQELGRHDRLHRHAQLGVGAQPTWRSTAIRAPMRLTASASTARTISSRSWRRCGRPPARPRAGAARLRPACASVRRSSGWKRTMSARTQNAQKFSSTNERLRRSACRDDEPGDHQESEARPASGSPPCRGRRAGRGRGRRRRWRCRPGRACGDRPAMDIRRPSPRPRGRAHAGAASRMASATRTARRTAATSWTRTMWAPAATAITQAASVPSSRSRRRQASRRAPMKLFREGPTRIGFPIGRNASSRFSSGEVVLDRLAEADSGVDADRFGRHAGRLRGGHRGLEPRRGPPRGGRRSAGRPASCGACPACA